MNRNFSVFFSYVVGSKSFRSDIQKPRQMENTVRDIYSAIYGEVNVSVEKCVEIKGDYVEKKGKLFYFYHLKKLVRPENFGPYYIQCYMQLRISKVCC